MTVFPEITHPKDSSRCSPWRDPRAAPGPPREPTRFQFIDDNVRGSIGHQYASNVQNILMDSTEINSWKPVRFDSRSAGVARGQRAVRHSAGVSGGDL